MVRQTVQRGRRASGGVWQSGGASGQLNADRSEKDTHAHEVHIPSISPTVSVVNRSSFLAEDSFPLDV